MKDRLRQFLAAENISQAQFADTLNVVRASVSHILSGRNNPSFDFIKAMMANYPRLNMEWLMFGKGKMYKDKEIPAEVMLFPGEEPETLMRLPDIPDEALNKATEQISDAIDTSINTIKSTNNQRSVSKIIILFDDGTFQEM